MNIRQWLVVGVGAIVAVSVFDIGTERLDPPMAGPRVEVSPGYVTQDYADDIVPSTTVFWAAGVVVLTAGIAYKMRTHKTA